METAVHEAVNQAGAHGGAFVPIALVIAVAALAGLGFLWLRQPPLVGFILAGILLGPTGFGLISEDADIAFLGEMGVVVLLFFIGMELSIRAFVLSLKQALLVVLGQLATAAILAGIIGFALEATTREVVILSFVFAISSTVVAMKMLDEMGALRGDAGKIAVGVLIAQDIAVVPMLIFVSSFGGDGFDVTQTLIKVVVAVGIMAGLLWYFSRFGKLKVPFSDKVEDKVELLALGALALCFSAAAISGVAGMSPAYGAFLAGICVGNSTLRSRIIPVVEPIQSVLLVIFFLSIGLLIDLQFIWDQLFSVLLVAFGVVAAKSVLNVMFLRWTGSSAQTALIAGLSMAQIGEFSFVLAAAGLSAAALNQDLYRLVIAVTAISLLVSPVWVSVMRRVEASLSEGLESYRNALALAYAQELREVDRGRAFVGTLYSGVRTRLKALSHARHERRRRKAEASSSEAKTTEANDT
ncbi:cation:proton antiporter [Martelella mediterranea]|uniref:Iron transporter MagA (CPA2 family) n=1 Tax=Martelella mediterranea TaxID=293089 RepID=A0A4R3NV31_9HYPH|nr:cation:proton antiporter [Martelella mediterranea]TCT37612.1 iron transporter MagA (CPA2 family) [Martelella mediterranea]